MNNELSQTSEQDKRRNPDGTFKPGVSGNPGGRPKGSMKLYIAKKLAEMSDEEKEQWLKDNKISGIDMWKMAEGNPKQDTEIDATVSGPTIIRLDE